MLAIPLKLLVGRNVMRANVYQTLKVYTCSCSLFGNTVSE